MKSQESDKKRKNMDGFSLTPSLMTLRENEPNTNFQKRFNWSRGLRLVVFAGLGRGSPLRWEYWNSIDSTIELLPGEKDLPAR
jgi:hypothetical protein